MSSILAPRTGGSILAALALATVAVAQEAPPSAGTTLPAAEVTAADVVADDDSPAVVRSAPMEDVPGRTVVADSREMVFEAREQLRLSDLDAETAETVRLINRTPGTYQTYFLSTWEFLPDRLFHPGFAIPLDRPKEAPELPEAEPVEAERNVPPEE